MKVLVFERNHEMRQHVVNTLLSADFAVEAIQSTWALTERIQGGRVILVVGTGDQGLLSIEAVRQSLVDCPGFYLLMLLDPESMMDQVKDGLRNGFDDFVFQPMNSAELILRVGIAERILNLKSVSGELTAPITAPNFQKRKSPSSNMRL